MRAILVAVAVSLCTAAASLAGPAAVAGVDGSGLPVEDYASYDPQNSCTKKPRAGTVALGGWLVTTYGGTGGAVNRPCSGAGASEHKDGRAVDWVLDADNPAQRKQAKAFLAAAFATDAEGNPAALARRMGIMYVIWSDKFYPAYDQFRPEDYLSSSCRSKRKCSKTLRHRDHMHISLSKAGARGLTSFYLDLLRTVPRVSS
jgi:hypothetical protein